MLAVAVPLHNAVPYVAGAYLVFLAIVLLYVAIMATRLGRVQHELAELNVLAAERERAPRPKPDSAAAAAPELSAVAGAERA